MKKLGFGYMRLPLLEQSNQTSFDLSLIHIYQIPENKEPVSVGGA